MDQRPPPYRLQVFFPEELRATLRDIAHEEHTSIQQLVVRWIVECIHQHPYYRRVTSETETGTSP